MDSWAMFAWLAVNAGTIFHLVIIIALGAIGISVVMKGVDTILERNENLKSVKTYIHSAARIGLWLLLAMIALTSLGIDLTSVIALFSVAGLAISLALQNTLSNLAGGIQVLMAKPFVVGDYVDTEKGSGTVTEIGLAYSKLTTVDNKAILIPNSQMADSKIVNYTSTGSRRVDITVTASYDAPVQNVRTAAMETIAKFPQIKSEPGTEFYVSEYGSSSISYIIRAWVDTADYWAVYFGMMEELRVAFDRNQVEMTYDHINVHVVKES